MIAQQEDMRPSNWGKVNLECMVIQTVQVE